MAKASIIAARQADAMREMAERLARIEAKLDDLLSRLAQETEAAPKPKAKEAGK